MYAIYKKGMLDSQLNIAAQDYLLVRTSFAADSYFISFPRLIEYYRGDFNCKTLTQLIEFLVKEVFRNDFDAQEQGMNLVR